MKTISVSNIKRYHQTQGPTYIVQEPPSGAKLSEWDDHNKLNKCRVGSKPEKEQC